VQCLLDGSKAVEVLDLNDRRRDDPRIGLDVQVDVCVAPK
jgi:hypothetical protein